MSAGKRLICGAPLFQRHLSVSNRKRFVISEKACTQARRYSPTFSVSARRPCRVGSRARDVRKVRHYGSWRLPRRTRPLFSRAEGGIKHKRRSPKAAEVLPSLMLRPRSGIASGGCYVQVWPPAPSMVFSTQHVPSPRSNVRPTLRRERDFLNMLCNLCPRDPWLAVQHQLQLLKSGLGKPPRVFQTQP